MLNQLVKLFREPEHGTVRFSFIALDENDKPYEEVATMPYHDEFVAADIERKFRSFMLLRKHLVLEITVLEVVKTSG
jgi:hypothetical protein